MDARHIRFISSPRQEAGAPAPVLPLLQHEESLAPAAWLQESLTTFGTSVASFLPGQFAAYARIPHRIEFAGAPTAQARVGSLPLEAIDILLEHLRPATTTPDRCYFAVWVGFAGSAVPHDLQPQLVLPHREYHLFSGPLAAARTSYAEGPFFHLSANLWWPADHAWCVATEIDHAWTFVGGPRRCVASILADRRLDAVATDAANRW